MGPIQSASRCARYSLTVTMCTPSPGKALRYAGRVAMSVLPSPVRISAMRPRCKARPPTSWTSKCRIPRVRRAASRTTAKASGASLSKASPAASRARNSAVLAPIASSDRACSADSKPIAASASRKEALTRRSLRLPKRRVSRLSTRGEPQEKGAIFYGVMRPTRRIASLGRCAGGRLMTQTLKDQPPI